VLRLFVDRDVLLCPPRLALGVGGARESVRGAGTMAVDVFSVSSLLVPRMRLEARWSATAVTLGMIMFPTERLRLRRRCGLGVVSGEVGVAKACWDHGV
jgi:hypothetical protein